MKILRIRNWDRYQHYKDNTTPPWVRLYRDTLTSRTWVSSDEPTRVLMIALILLAAENDNATPYDAEYIKRRAYLTSVPLERLIELEFVEVVAGKRKSSKSKSRDSLEPSGCALEASEASLCTEVELDTEVDITTDVTRATEAASSAEQKPHRLPESWVPDDDDREFARRRGFTEPEIDDAALEFSNYWRDVEGARGRKKSWKRTWQNRIIELAGRRKPRSVGQRAGTNGQEPGGVVGAVSQVLAVLAQRKEQPGDGRGGPDARPDDGAVSPSDAGGMDRGSVEILPPRHAAGAR